MSIPKHDVLTSPRPILAARNVANTLRETSCRVGVSRPAACIKRVRRGSRLGPEVASMTAINNW